MAFLTEPAALMALFAGFFVALLIFFAAIYIYNALVLMTIAKKTNTPNGWLAWIPIANVYLMTQLAGVSGWWTLAILLAFIPFIGGLALAGIMVWWWWKIAERRGFDGWLSLLMLIPLVNLVVMGIIAWKK